MRVETPAGRRLIALDGAVNFRDLGGYETADGRAVRWGSVFRSDGLAHLSEADRATLARLGVRTVIDLRSDVEVSAGRFPFEDLPVDFHHLPVVASLPHPEVFRTVPGFLASQYKEMMVDGGPRIARALGLLAGQASLPAVFHCTAGKDRTGVLSAVLLGVLGVPTEVVVADYSLSAAAMERLRALLAERIPHAGPTIAAVEEMFSAAPANMESLLAWTDDHYGSMRAYAAAIGVEDATIAALEDNLLV